MIGRHVSKSGPSGGAPSNRNTKRTMRKRKRNRMRKRSTVTLDGNPEKAQAMFNKRQKSSRAKLWFDGLNYYPANAFESPAKGADDKTVPGEGGWR